MKESTWEDLAFFVALAVVALAVVALALAVVALAVVALAAAAAALVAAAVVVAAAAEYPKASVTISCCALALCAFSLSQSIPILLHPPQTFEVVCQTFQTHTQIFIHSSTTDTIIKVVTQNQTSIKTVVQCP